MKRKEEANFGNKKHICVKLIDCFIPIEKYIYILWWKQKKHAKVAWKWWSWLSSIQIWEKTEQNPLNVEVTETPAVDLGALIYFKDSTFNYSCNSLLNPIYTHKKQLGKDEYR